MLVIAVGGLTGCFSDFEEDAALAPESEEDALGSAAQAVESCDSNAGKWTHLANLAVAVAQEMGELNTARQFAIGTGPQGSRVVLSAYGNEVCDATSGCPVVKGLLDLQDLPNDVYVPQNIFNVIDYRNSLVNMYQQQAMQIAQFIANDRFDLLPEAHRLTFNGEAGTATCGTPWYSFLVNRDLELSWSSAGPLANRICTAITEPSDPHGWNDNYLCSSRDLGLGWSSNGVNPDPSPSPTDTAVPVNEPADPNGWNNNVLFTPENLGLIFSSSGPQANQSCTAITEPADPNGWGDNYLCYDQNALLNHPSTLCQEFWMYGGAASCGGSNPYIDFVVSPDNASIKFDPTDYNSGGINTTQVPKCVTTIPYISTTYSTGRCCYVNGKYGTLARITTRPNTYYCKIS